MSETTTITLPISSDILSVIGILLGLLAASALISLVLPRGPKTHMTDDKSFVIRWFRIMDLGPIERVIVAFVLMAMAVLFLMAIAATFTIVIGTILGGLDPSAARGFGTGALLVALLGSPFLIWRSMVGQSTLDETRFQTKLQDEALFNDKINAAAKDLAARHQVTTRLREGTETEEIETEWQDDLVTRAAAIDRLEGLALEAFDRGDIKAAQRIARMLSIYVQELSRQYPPEEPPESATPEEFRDWARSLKPARADMERAAQSLGRINTQSQTPDKIKLNSGANLSEANLQGMSLWQVDLSGSDLRRSNLDGIRGFEAQLERVYLVNTSMKFANFAEAKMPFAVLQDADMRATVLRNTDLSQAQITKTDLSGAWLGHTNLQSTALRHAVLNGALCTKCQTNDSTDFSYASLRGAALYEVSDALLDLTRDQWDQFFYAAETLPEDAPDHWIEAKLNYDDFVAAWRAWAAEHHPDITIAPDYHRDA
ncbi:pentapeptide repeat-containing protein [Gymnodinialimonas sp. 2305UL16-5]|uniref:pentapeptide repeat-containing protein n=1 Tax=Gymnodinialimonas mytili TaxID=3126503 RepID=UPI0030992F41